MVVKLARDRVSSVSLPMREEAVYNAHGPFCVNTVSCAKKSEMAHAMGLSSQLFSVQLERLWRTWRFLLARDHFGVHVLSCAGRDLVRVIISEGR